MNWGNWTDIWGNISIMWWVVGGAILVFIGQLLLIGHVVMIIVDHRRHRNWRSTVLAVVWPGLCVAMLGVLQTNMSPPLFGIPLLLLFSMVWLRKRLLFALGVALYYGLSTLVLVSAVGSGYVHWWFLVFWPVSFVALIMWRKARILALTTAALVSREVTAEKSTV